MGSARNGYCRICELHYDEHDASKCERIQELEEQLAAMAFRTCSTCIHFLSNPLFPSHGFCAKQIVEAKGMVTPNFGCNQWEAIP